MIYKIQCLWFAACLLIISSGISAQEQQPQQADLSSPYHAVYNHLYYLQPDSYQPEMAAQSLFAPQLEPAAKEKLSVKLKQILDGRGKYVDLNLLPDDPNYIDSSKGKAVYILFPDYPQVYVEKIKGRWYYSRTTVGSINALHKEVYPFGSDLLVNLFPEAGQLKFLGLQGWQWLGIFALLFISYLIHLILKRLLNLILVNIMARRFQTLENPKTTFRKLARVSSFLLINWLLIYMVPVLLLPIKASQAVNVFLNIFMSVLIVFLVLRIIDVVMVYLKVLAERTQSNMDDQLMPIASRILKSVAVVAGSFYILKVLNVNVTALIAGVSIGGLALALAAQDTVKNFIGSVMIFFDQPFQIGDWINFDGNDGTVEEVGVRSTRIRTFSNSLLSVPNGKLADMVIDNMGLRIFRRYKTNIGVTYDTPPVLIEAFVKGIKEILGLHPGTKKDSFEVALNSFGDFSLNILINVYFSVPDWSTELKSKHEIMLAIIHLAEELGVQFAFPTSTLHIENMPGQISNSPNYEKDLVKVDARLETFLGNVNSFWEKA